MSMGRNWTNAEKLELLTTGYVNGRSRRSIRLMKIKLNLISKQNHRRRWTQLEINKLIMLHKNGMTANFIFRAGLLPFSRNAIQKTLNRLNLSNKRKIFKFSEPQRNKLKQFLMDNFINNSPSELTEKWNDLYPSLKVNKYRIVRYLCLLNIKISKPMVHMLNIVKKKEAKIFANDQLNADKKIEQIRQLRSSHMRKRLKSATDIWTGLPLSTIDATEAREDVNDQT